MSIFSEYAVSREMDTREVLLDRVWSFFNEVPLCIIHTFYAHLGYFARINSLPSCKYMRALKRSVAKCCTENARMPRKKMNSEKSGAEDLSTEVTEGRASVSLSKELAVEIDRYVSIRELGFDSRAAFIKEGIRTLFLKYRQLHDEICERKTPV